MHKTITPVDNTIYVEREYHSKKDINFGITETIIKIVYKSIKKRYKLK